MPQQQFHIHMLGTEGKRCLIDRSEIELTEWDFHGPPSNYIELNNCVLVKFKGKGYRILTLIILLSQAKPYISIYILPGITLQCTWGCIVCCFNLLTIWLCSRRIAHTILSFVLSYIGGEYKMRIRAPSDFYCWWCHAIKL